MAHDNDTLHSDSAISDRIGSIFLTRYSQQMPRKLMAFQSRFVDLHVIHISKSKTVMIIPSNYKGRGLRFIDSHISGPWWYCHKIGRRTSMSQILTETFLDIFIHDKLFDEIPSKIKKHNWIPHKYSKSNVLFNGTF